MQTEDSTLLNEKVTIYKMRVLLSATLCYFLFKKFRAWSKKLKLMILELEQVL